jgi:hypothetical protein
MGGMKRSVCGCSWIRYLSVPSLQGRLDHLLRDNLVGCFDYQPPPNNKGLRESNCKPFLDAN